MGLPSHTQAILSKIATNDGHGENSPYFDGWKAYDSNPFHPMKNPDGVIQMGLAENQLCFDLIEDWMKRHPEASICTPEGVDQFKDIAIFQDYHGLAAFRNAVAKFMGRVRGNKATFNPDNIVMSGGATGAAETISFCIADPGDAFLVPSPYYPAFDRDFGWRTGVKLVPVVCESSNNFVLTVAALESAYKTAQDAGIKIKGLLINNPSNPLGTTLDRGTLRSIVEFINQKNIHLICDEIYAATVFSKPDFISVAEILLEVDFNKDLVHILYSLSKDMGFPGFRVGIIYSYNKQVVAIARKMSSFGLVSTQTQHLIASMLSDDEFVEKFLSESANRLKLRHQTLTQGLAEVNIGTLKSNSGLYFWMDLRKLLKESTYEEEMKLWRVIINEVKLNVSPGSSFNCSEPGWFRVCFANMDDDTMEVALTRIRTFVRQSKEPEVRVKSHRWRNSLRLSFSSLRCEDNMLTPRAMTPHTPMSPIPHSPLVRAV
ncbi:1-aminocyclopropane-1-carboxylate synthase [Ranunculus cassubicifolius]